MNPPFDIPADLDTPVSAFLKLAPLAPRFLLESVVGGDTVGRFSFLGLGDGIEVLLDDHATRIGDELLPAARTAAEVKDHLRRALAAAPRLSPELPGVPFTGGLVGQVDHDLVRRFEPVGARPDAPPRAAFFAPRSVLVFDHVQRRVALLHEGTEAQRADLRRRVLACLRRPVPDDLGGGPSTSPTPSLSRAAFCDAVHQTQRLIRDGEVFQLVLSTRFTGTTTAHPFAVYRALRLLNPSPYMVYLQVGGRTLVGSSPEALVTLRGTEARLRPIAGTRPRSPDATEDQRLEDELRADPKEGAEHVMLVDLARNDLGRVAAPGTVEVRPFREVERYSHVMHLVSGVHGQLRPDIDAFDLFEACFPAGTVSGAPKVRALQHIDRLEPVARGFYAGTMGYFGHGGTLDHALAIRTLCFEGDRYAFQAGAGIVADSRPDAEYDEVLAKSEAMRRALDLAAQLGAREAS